jgi:hypothetical protein
MIITIDFKNARSSKIDLQAQPNRRVNADPLPSDQTFASLRKKQAMYPGRFTWDAMILESWLSMQQKMRALNVIDNIVIQPL